MLFHRRSTFFPFLIVGLTLGLLLFMYVTFSYRSRPTAPVNVQEESASISAEDYRIKILEIDASFEEGIDRIVEMQPELEFVQSTLETLLEMRVPPVYQQTHLELVLALSMYINASADDFISLELALNRWKEAINTLP